MIDSPVLRWPMYSASVSAAKPGLETAEGIVRLADTGDAKGGGIASESQTLAVQTYFIIHGARDILVIAHNRY